LIELSPGRGAVGSSICLGLSALADSVVPAVSMCRDAFCVDVTGVVEIETDAADFSVATDDLFDSARDGEKLIFLNATGFISSTLFFFYPIRLH